MAIDRWAVALNMTMMETTSKEDFVCFSYLIRTLWPTLKHQQFNVEKPTFLVMQSKDIQSCFWNLIQREMKRVLLKLFIKKLWAWNILMVSDTSSQATEGERLESLKAYRADSNVQNMAKAVFDFSMKDEDRFEFLFETGKKLKLMWQFIFISFFH